MIQTAYRKGRSFLPQGIGEGFLEDIPVELSFGRCRSQVFGSGEGYWTVQGEGGLCLSYGKWRGQ